MTFQTFAKDHELQAEDEQVFLNKQLGLLNQSANQSVIGIPRQDSVMRSLTGVSKSGDRRLSLTSQGQCSPTKKVSKIYQFFNYPKHVLFLKFFYFLRYTNIIIVGSEIVQTVFYYQHCTTTACMDFTFLPLSNILQIDPVKTANTSTPGEGVLANFFNSLLHKKSNQSYGLTKSSSKYIFIYI